MLAVSIKQHTPDGGMLFIFCSDVPVSWYRVPGHQPEHCCPVLIGQNGSVALNQCQSEGFNRVSDLCYIQLHCFSKKKLWRNVVIGTFHTCQQRNKMISKGRGCRAGTDEESVFGQSLLTTGLMLASSSDTTQLKTHTGTFIQRFETIICSSLSDTTISDTESRRRSQRAPDS